MSADHWTELATRAMDGLEVSLLWSRRADRIKVTVSDERLGEAFELDVDGADALSAFHHPFAHAAALGVPYGEPLRDSNHLQLHT